jgi:hypothetical protein
MDDPITKQWSANTPPNHGNPPTTLFQTEDGAGTDDPGQEQERAEPEASPDSSPNEQPRPTAKEQVTSERRTMTSHELPDDVDLVTVEEAVTLFRERGLPRHIRTIQKYCARASGRALICYQTPTENGVRYLIEKASIDRFIVDAVHQAPTGQPESVQDPIVPSRENAEASDRSWFSSDLGIYDHPYVKHLESRNDRLEDKNDRLQGEIQSVLEAANERLIELQKANAVAQSETLGTFLLEAERIRTSQDDGDAAHSPPSYPTNGSESLRADV